MSTPLDVTQLLSRMRAGDAAARDELVPRVYDVLKVIAAGAIQRFDGRATIAPTALVHEAYLKILGPTPDAFENREHFLSVAATAMRNMLVDHARARAAQKRGGDRGREELDDLMLAFEETSAGILDLHAALERLATIAPKGARIVELSFFGGLSHAEIATLLDTSVRTIEREWRAARAWLYATLVDGERTELLDP